ncbi:MAG TPA: hypothetical protein VK645_01965 [Chitinophagaceae bacterium]|nr:hypothetical protein [Chitinophagaceae bacterium]
MTFIKILAVIKIAVAIWLMGIQALQSNNFVYVSGRVAMNGAAAAESLSDTNTPDPKKLFTKADADKIMGQSTHLTDSSSKVEMLISSYLCGYKADVKDSKTGKTGAIYFLFEQYRQIPDAKKNYAGIMKANKPHGIEDLSDLGDEAYYHTDGTNFYFIMVRKGKNVFNIKVNKITSATSLNEFKKTANRIAASL